MFTIYCYTNKINGKKYIGITSRSMKERETHIYMKQKKCDQKIFRSNVL